MSKPPEPRRGVGRVAQRAAQEVRLALRPYTIPNGITLLRLVAVPLFALAVVERNYRWALAIFLLAGLSDALDGALARWLASRSLLGAYLDPIADKALLVTAYIVLTWPAPEGVRIPVWLTVMALSRDVLIVLVALLLYLAGGVREFAPSFLGKATTVVHIITVGTVVVANLRPLDDVLLSSLFYLALGLTVLSGLDYLRRAALQLEQLHDARG
ncbi:MAG: CDP-alcohol phosphatidyltransferase family protein [Thermoanaerobaculum sp.]|nr:CDP-alcohol phosphatidyltransferase family protein [Thermoanaerobaculum sp.]MDW7968072.1 CDP-alcohol phosphatidyltransferase family protein [Thermoanaerobaculum sp.]